MSSGAVFREAFDYPFSRLDPTGAHIDPPAVALYETAVAKGPDWAPHPLLAESWTVSDDGLGWTVRLRPGLRFHSGAPCDAAAVLAAYELLREHTSDERQLWYWDPVDTVVADGPVTLRFRLHHPYARLPSLLWGTHTAVFNVRATRPDGTGPYRMVSWSPERIVAERWPGYSPPAAGFLAGRGLGVERIEWIAILDEAERLHALERGDVDCLHGPPLTEVARLQADERFVVTTFPQASNFYLAPDWRHRALGFDDLRVRRALSLAIDRRALVRTALSGRGEPTRGPIGPGDEYYDASVDADLDVRPAEAAALLDAAGWMRDADGVRKRDGQSLAFACLTQDDPVFRRVIAEVQRQLAAIGVRLEPRFATPFAPFYAACVSGHYPATLSKWLWQDGIDAVIGFSSSSTAPMPNWEHAAVPEVDAAYATYLRASHPAELAAAASEAQHRFAEHLPYIPLATPHDVFVHRVGVTGWQPYRANLYPYYHGVELSERPSRTCTSA
jgi:peptide/nickel transport system substrate-binding protein